MPYRVLYHPLVREKGIPKLNATMKQIIKTAVENRLLTEPEKDSEPLRKR